MSKMCNVGINDFLSYALKGTSRPSFYIGIFTNTSEPAATATLSSITEPSGGAYARQQLVDGDWTVASQIATNLQKTFQATGAAWGNCYGWFICTVLSGTSGDLICVEAFSDGPYNVADGDQVRVTAKLTGS